MQQQPTSPTSLDLAPADYTTVLSGEIDIVWLVAGLGLMATIAVALWLRRRRLHRAR